MPYLRWYPFIDAAIQFANIFSPLESSTAEEQRYKVVYDYSPENDDELTLKKGDSVIVTNKDICDGWWEGRSNGKSGVFPNNFVELLSAAETVTKEKVCLIVRIHTLPQP